MLKDDFEKLVDSMKGKLGEENTSLIADDLGLLMSDNSKMNIDIENRNTEITKLKERETLLQTTNMNLLQQVGMSDDPIETKKQQKEEPKEKLSLKDCFDEKGKFKQKI